MLQALAPGGLVILTAYHKEQLAFGTGGPPVEEMLYTAYVSLGSNLGDRRSLLESAVVELASRPGIDLLTVSSLFETEPVDLENPLLRMDNVIVTPHIAWAAREARQRLVDELAENIRGFLGGHPRNVVAAP
jgi:hypothetical protein